LPACAGAISTERITVKNLVAILLAATFLGGSVSAIAGTEKKSAEKKPTAEECKKNPKLKGCEKAK
jgi:hypothetical protein